MFKGITDEDRRLTKKCQELALAKEGAKGGIYHHDQSVRDIKPKEKEKSLVETRKPAVQDRGEKTRALQSEIDELRAAISHGSAEDLYSAGVRLRDLQLKLQVMQASRQFLELRPALLNFADLGIK